MHHHNVVDTEDQAVIGRRTKIGLILLSVYGFAYAVFIGLCAFGSKFLADCSPWGIPLAIWYGMGLMLGAMLMALLYGRLCRVQSSESSLR